jgi:hypothetical protein
MTEDEELTPVGKSLPVRALFSLPEWYGDLIRTARSMYGAQPEIAIVISQIAVETYVELALAELLRREGQSDDRIDERLEEVSPLTFRRDKTVAEWRRLTGDPVRQRGEWPAYVEHIKRRNGIVHRGRRATKDEASASIEACASLIQHMQNVLRSILT